MQSNDLNNKSYCPSGEAADDCYRVLAASMGVQALDFVRLADRPPLLSTDRTDEAFQHLDEFRPDS